MSIPYGSQQVDKMSTYAVRFDLICACTLVRLWNVCLGCTSMHLHTDFSYSFIHSVCMHNVRPWVMFGNYFVAYIFSAILLNISSYTYTSMKGHQNTSISRKYMRYEAKPDFPLQSIFYSISSCHVQLILWSLWYNWYLPRTNREVLSTCSLRSKLPIPSFLVGYRVEKFYVEHE